MAKFWLSVLTELKSRGLLDILIACVDGLIGFPEAIAAEFPHSRSQLCLILMVRNSLKYVTWKNFRVVTPDLKEIHKATTEGVALQELPRFAEKCDVKYPQISKSWHNHWPNLVTLYEYPPDIRRVIYTTNAIESLNRVIRKATRQRKVFPTDESVMRLVHLAIQSTPKKWTIPIRNWKPRLNRFTIAFGDRLADY